MTLAKSKKLATAQNTMRNAFGVATNAYVETYLAVEGARPTVDHIVRMQLFALIDMIETCARAETDEAVDIVSETLDSVYYFLDEAEKIEAEAKTATKN